MQNSETEFLVPSVKCICYAQWTMHNHKLMAIREGLVQKVIWRVGVLISLYSLEEPESTTTAMQVSPETQEKEVPGKYGLKFFHVVELVMVSWLQVSVETTSECEFVVAPV